jgi:hypothetical protein
MRPQLVTLLTGAFDGLAEPIRIGRSWDDRCLFRETRNAIAKGHIESLRSLMPLPELGGLIDSGENGQPRTSRLRKREAADAYRLALELEPPEAERAFIARRLRQLAAT